MISLHLPKPDKQAKLQQKYGLFVSPTRKYGFGPANTVEGPWLKDLKHTLQLFFFFPYCNSNTNL